MKPFDLETFDKNKNYVLEASAGTGKTYSIVEMIKRIIADDPSIFEKLLVVTYTEKATGELKNRIRDEIPNVNTDTASIFTIHSFCKSVINEFGITSNLPLDLGLVNDIDLQKFTDRYFRSKKILHAASVFKKCAYSLNLDTLKELFLRGISKYYLNFKYEEDIEIVSLYKDGDHDYEAIYSNMEKIASCESFDDYLNLFPDAKAQYDILSRDNSEGAKKAIELIQSTYSSCFSGKVTYGDINKGSKSREAIDYFQNLYKYFGGSQSDRKQLPRAIFGDYFFKEYFVDWQKEKEFNKAQNFDDMIRSVRETIISNDDLVNKLRNKYKYGIIDEFQDTNQKQFDIFKRVFLCDDHHLIVVGDPKQSIYSFQGADVNVYNKAKEEISNVGEACSLTKNWRSSKEIVDFANDFFSPSNGFDFGITEFNNSTSCGKFHTEYDGQKDPVAIWIGADEGGGKINHKEFARIAVQQIVDCCSYKGDKTKLQIPVKVGNEIELHNVKFSDFAILARTRSEMPAIKNALKNAGIPYIPYKDTTLFKGIECAHWLAVLQAIDIPDFTGYNRRIFKKALFTEFFGLSLLEISDKKYEERDDIDEIKLFNKWKLLAKRELWEDLIDSVLNESKLFTIMNESNKAQSFYVFKQVGDYCIDYLSEDHNLGDLIERLTNLANGDEDDESGSIVGRGTDSECVKIMTIHASKGLEFPVVICPGGFKGVDPNKTFPCIYHDSNDNGLQKLMFNGDSKAAVNEIKEEYKRLFYVAYTRAKSIMILPNLSNFSKDLSFLNEAFDNYLSRCPNSYRYVHNSKESYESLREKVKDILDRNRVNRDTIELDDQKNIIKSMIDEEKKNSRKTYKHSYSSLSHTKEDEDEDNKEGEQGQDLSCFDTHVINEESIKYDSEAKPIDLGNKYPKGTGVGSALHRVFELMDYQKDDDIKKMSIIKKCLDEEMIHIEQEGLDKTLTMINRVLEASFPVIEGNTFKDAYFKLKDVPFIDKRAEVDFDFNLMLNDVEYEKLKNYFNGSIDLVFKRGDRYAIIDWKSDSINDKDLFSYYTFKHLKDHVDNCYSIQRVLYAYTLIRWLAVVLKKKEQEVFNDHFGGVYYVFIRGCNENTSNGIYAQTWSNWDTLKEAFNDIVDSKKIRRRS